VLQESDPDKIISALRDLKENHSKDSYLHTRLLFNKSAQDVLQNCRLPKSISFERALQFLYLNKTGFNGLIRYNLKNEWNVPYGDYSNPSLCNEGNIKAIHQLFNTLPVSFYCGDFTFTLKETLDLSIEEDKPIFIYADPPYHPITETSNFTTYTGVSFTGNDQIRLKESLEEISYYGGKFLISNSNCQFIRDLYKDYNIIEVSNSRSINCKGNKRGKIKEIIITNY